ncbi:MAG: flap endonuclease-1 [Thermoproteota archaeon]|nr:MAG: flap endonuclease-1 [Candidatus Korarchaeota archaeon]
MGAQISPLIPRVRISLRKLAGKAVAVDAYNAMYQFLALIRTEYGTPLRDRRGRVTSHLNGLLYRTIRLLEAGVTPVYVFDGPPPRFKARELEERRAVRERAMAEWAKAVEEGDLRRAWAKAVASSRLSREMAEDAKVLLTLMGVPWVQAPSEGEAQSAYMAASGDVWAAASQDYDSILFGAPRLVRNLTITGRKFLRKRPVSYRLIPELVELDAVLSRLKLSRRQLIEVAILAGTDYNQGVYGIGPKKAYKLISRYGSLEKAAEAEKLEIDESWVEVREFYLHPPVTDRYSVELGELDEDGLLSFLVEERDFDPRRVREAVRRLKLALQAASRVARLEV